MCGNSNLVQTHNLKKIGAATWVTGVTKGVTEGEKFCYKDYRISGYTAIGFDHGLTLATNHHCKPSQKSHSFTG